MTGWEMLIILLILGIALGFIFAVNKFWRNEVRREMKLRKEWQKCAYDLEKEVRRYKYLSDDLRRQCGDLLDTCKELRYKMNNHMTPMCNDDMLYAVKYVMKHAHPDHGGKQEDFIRFNEMYKRMKH